MTGQNRETAARLRRERADRKTYSVEAVEREIRRGRKQDRRRRNRRDRLVVVLLALVLAAVASMRFVTFIRISGTGMRPTLETGALVMCLREGSPVTSAKLRRGEVAVFEHQKARVVRRVIAVGGDVVDIDGDALTVNGTPSEYGTGVTAESGDLVYPITVPDGELFVLGDNRSLAIDSRSREFGTVPMKEAAGRPKLIVWPAYCVGLVDGGQG